MSHRRRWMVTLIPVWVWPLVIRVPWAWLHDACDEPASTDAPLRSFEYTRKREGLCITCHKVRGQPVGSDGRAVDVAACRGHILCRRVDKRCTEAADKSRRSHCTTATHAVRFLAPEPGSMLLKWWAHLTVSCPSPCGQEGHVTSIPHGQEDAGHANGITGDGSRAKWLE